MHTLTKVILIIAFIFTCLPSFTLAQNPEEVIKLPDYFVWIYRFNINFYGKYWLDNSKSY